MAEFVETCLFGDIDEYDWRAVHKSARCDRAGHRIFHGGMRGTGGNSRGFRFFLLTILGFLSGGARPEPCRNEDKRERTQTTNIPSHLKSFLEACGIGNCFMRRGLRFFAASLLKRSSLRMKLSGATPNSIALFARAC